MAPKAGLVWIRVAMAVFSVCAGSARALDREDLLFHLTFEHGFDADFSRGGAQAAIEGSVDLVPNEQAGDLSGRNGTRAARFVDKGDLLRYALSGNVHLPQGAVSLWLYEIDTPEKQRIWNPYFQVAGKDEALNILRLWQPIQWAGGLWRNGQKVAMAGGNVVEVPGTERSDTGDRGRWNHIVYTWRKNAMALYVNGEPKGTAAAETVFLAPPSSFTLGRPRRPTLNADDHHTGEHLLKDAPEKAAEMKIGNEPCGAYLLDDVAIFNRFLAPEEVSVVFSNALEKALDAGVTGTATLRFDHFVSSGKIKADVAFGRRLPDNAVAAVHVLNTDGAPTPVEGVLSGTPAGFETLLLDVGGLPQGSYRVVARAMLDGKTLAETAAQPLAITPREAWLANAFGAEDVVLPGFEPLRVNGSTVALWGRSYDFSNAIMPRQIVNQGKEMLARPIHWFVRIQGRDLPLNVDVMKLVDASDTQARYEGEGTLGPLALKARVMIEYDGFMKFDLSFAPGSVPIKVEKLWMEIPLIPAQSRNFFHPTRRSGDWADGWTSPLTPLTRKGVITLGTPDVSLQWLTESDQHYFPQDCSNALATVETPDARIFQTTVIAEAKEIDKPFTLTFALHAGPVRPRPANWRGYTFVWGGSLANHGRKHLDPERHTALPFSYDFWARTPGSLIPRNGFPERADKNLLKDKICMTSLHFAGFRHFDEKDPQKRLSIWEKYESEWERIPRRISVGNTAASGWNEQSVDANSTWGQWHIYNCHRLFTETGVRGLYYDDWLPGVSMNEAAGSGYVDEKGIRRPTYPIFSQRELHRRVYAIVKKCRPNDGFVMIHTASSILLPIVSFSDMIYDGEILNWSDHRPEKGNYFETFKNSYFQTLFSCRSYGPIGGFHDETTLYDKPAMAIAKQRQLWAKYLLHDIHSYGGHRSGADELLYFYLDHGFPLTNPDIKFHAYWDESPAARPLKASLTNNDKEVIDRASEYLAVAYSNSHGEALVVVVRDGSRNPTFRGWGPMNVRVQLDRARLGLPDGDLQSLSLESLGRVESGRMEGDVLTLPVSSDDFSAVILRPRSFP